jgi:hypothetical protein
MSGSGISRHLPGCLGGLALFAALAVAIHRLLVTTQPPELRLGLAAAAALCLALGLNSFWHLAQGFGSGERSRDAMFARARTGVPPADGEPVIATGQVRSEGEPLLAPLSRVPCVSYEYRMYYTVYHPGRFGRYVPVPVYWGYACRGFAIDSPASRVPVRAVPILSIPAQQNSDPAWIERARQLVQSTQWELVAPLATGLAVFERTREAMTDDDGEASRHCQRKGDARDPAELILEETVLPVGATVSVHGTWSAERGAIVARASAAGSMGVQLVLGPPEGLKTAAHLKGFGSYLAFAASSTALGVGIVYFALKVLPKLR